MSSFWPEDITIEDTRSPKEILEEAQIDWEENTDGIMSLVLQDSDSGTGSSMLIVHATHLPSNITAELFSVVWRSGFPYPSAIQPRKEDDIPQFLKKKYSVKVKNPNSIGGLVRSNTGLTGMLAEEETYKTVENHWVADTPVEFEQKLASAFKLASVKRIVLNLAAKGKEAAKANLENLEV